MATQTTYHIIVELFYFGLLNKSYNYKVPWAVFALSVYYEILVNSKNAKNNPL